MAKTLDLTAAQQTQIEAIAARAKDGVAGTTWKSMRTAHEALAGVIRDPGTTDDQVRDAAAAVAAIGTELAVEHHKMVIEIAAILTADQKAKLAEMKASFKEHHQSR
jgi:Spy/CpxP family protein refolding chaperone